MQIFYRLFAFVCEECEDGATEFGSLLASNSCVDRIFAEAAEGVVFEVGRGWYVLQVLKAADNTSTCLALWGSTGENMARLIFMILEGNVGFEEWIYGWAPSSFEKF
jgi:hypothetical protein